MTTNNAIVDVGQMGAGMYVQSLNGVLYTEDQIGFMADRILWTEGQIGEMANRIVYITEISQNNMVVGQYMVMSMSFAGMDSTMNNMYKYYVTVQPGDDPWRTRVYSYYPGNSYNYQYYRGTGNQNSWY